MIPVRKAVSLAVAALLGGCAVGPNYHTPKVSMPDRYAAVPVGAASAAVATHVDFAGWWRSLQDPELDSLIERAVKNNPDVLIALDRLQAAREYEFGTVSSFLPQAEASAGGGKGTGSDLGRGRASQQLVSAETGNGFTQVNALAGFDAAWELDIFGKYRRELEAARDTAQAAAAARNSVLVAVIADVARAYVDLRGLQVQASVLRAAVAVLTESLRIVNIRYERGITNELDVTLARRELATVQAQVSPVDAQVNAAQYAIATLIGEFPEQLVKELTPKAMIPTVPSLVPAGLPVDLLRRRPDIEEAERQLAAANAQIGVATASLFPQVAITGAVGVERQGFGTTPVMSQHIWAAGPAAMWPLLDFGALDAQVEVASFNTRAQLVQYKRTIQDAVRDVDTAWDAYRAQQASLASLGQALLASHRAVTLANERYERGLTDFLNVVDAERQDYEIQEQYAAAQVMTDEQFIELYRSLGGGWQSYQSLPPIHTPEPAIIAVFQRVLERNDALQPVSPSR